jgi:hypothetical protein
MTDLAESENGSRFERKGKRTLVEDHENEEDVQRREEDTCPEWDGGYEQVDGDGGPEQLGEVGHDDSGFGPLVPDLVDPTRLRVRLRPRRPLPLRAVRPTGFVQG